MNHDSCDTEGRQAAEQKPALDAVANEVENVLSEAQKNFAELLGRLLAQLWQQISATRQEDRPCLKDTEKNNRPAESHETVALASKPKFG